MNEPTQAAPAASPLETLPADAAAALVHLAGTLHVLAGEAQRNADATPTREAAKLAKLARDATSELHAIIDTPPAAPEAEAPRTERMTTSALEADAQRRTWTATALPDLLAFSTSDICAPEESEQAACLLLVTLEALTEYDAAASVSLRADALQAVLQSLIDAHGATRMHLRGLREAAAAYVRMQAVQP